MLLVDEPDIDTDESTNIIPARSIGRVSLHFIVTQLLSARTDNAAVTSSIRAELKSGAVEFPSAWDRI
jgi:hypothetical protein